MKNIRKLYNERLRIKSINGRIDTKFYVLGNGEVVNPLIVKSTINDTIFENIVIKEIDSWRFDRIKPKDDTTEVNYPFIFRK